MNNNKYESMRTFLVAGFLVCSCVLTQAQAQEVNQLAPSANKAQLYDSLSDTGNAADYTQLLLELESEFGPFDARLSEPLLSYGDMLAQRGDYLEALGLLERALHVTRISQGLYSAEQIAIVERLIDCNVALENWVSVDDNYSYMHFLYTRLYKRGTDQWYHGIAQVSDWHIVAINNGLTEDLTYHLREANNLFQQRLTMAEEMGIVDEEVLQVLRHNVETTALHLRKQDEGMTTEIYGRLESRYSDRDRVASLD